MQRRKLSRGHFAFMRALAQGLDPASSWERYLDVEGRSADARLVKSTVRWLRDEFAAAARRQGRPGTARLVQLDPTLLPRDHPRPDLAEFAALRGLQDFSEAEQTEAYTEVYGAGTRNSKRRIRLIERQLAGLAWLEQLVAEDPAPGDPVEAWLSPAIASRLAFAGVPTLFALAERINGKGEGWHRGITAIGTGKAARLVRWVTENEHSIGVKIGSHVARRRSALSVRELHAVVSTDTAIRPLEKFLVPAAFDGSAGAFRAPKARCLLSADTDYEAVHAWLSTKRPTADGKPSNTHRGYRKEAERLMLWAILVRRKPLSSLSVEDAGAYLDFLGDPPASWCGQRHSQRWSPLWRPLEGPLKPAAQAHAVTVLRILYSWLTTQGYVVGNPFAAVNPPKVPVRAIGTGKVLTIDQMRFAVQQLELLPSTEPNKRLRLAVAWMYATGMRISEMVAARCGDVSRIDYTNAKGEAVDGWLLTVVGKGEKLREVPVPHSVVRQLNDRLASLGWSGDCLTAENADVPILARVEAGDVAMRTLPVAEGGLYKSIKAFFAHCALELSRTDPHGAERFIRASSHWLRHTYASHAVNGSPGQAAVPLQIMQSNLGHASPATTTGYITTERDVRIEAMRGFFAEDERFTRVR